MLVEETIGIPPTMTRLVNATRRERETDDRMQTEVLDSTSRSGRNGGRREKRPMKTAQELDDELQAFLEGKN